jgi:hypothetical protein
LEENGLCCERKRKNQLDKTLPAFTIFLDREFFVVGNAAFSREVRILDEF